MKRKAIISLLLAVTFSTPANAQDRFSNTLTIDYLSKSPDASLADIAWIQGHWQGNNFGGVTETVWTPSLGGSMMGVFKLVKNGQIEFYELVTISEEGNTLIIRLKHFDRYLRGWEEKDTTVTSPLVKITRNKVFFNGFTFERVNKNEINTYVRLENKNGIQEEKFKYKRVMRGTDDKGGR